MEKFFAGTACKFSEISSTPHLAKPMLAVVAFSQHFIPKFNKYAEFNA